MKKDFDIDEKIGKIDFQYHGFSDELTAILDSSQDGIHVTDADGRTILFNKACERIDNVRRQDIIGKNMGEMVEKGYYSKSVALKVIEEEKCISIIQHVRGKEIIATGTPIFRDGNLFRIIINSRDVTEINDLKVRLKKANREKDEYKFLLEKFENEKTNSLVSKNVNMNKLIDLAIRVAKVDSTILIQGESGVGKGVLSNFIHENSNRKKNPFFKIDCAAIPETLLESELFGYEKGSFSGASSDGKIGLIELANKGTLFLDEIGELPLNLQGKFLRLMQDREFIKIGGNKTIPVDIRIIAASNKNLEKMVEEKKFRADLFYRLNIVPIYLPPLRDRREDIIVLIETIIKKINHRYNTSKLLHAQTIKKLIGYDWPGNIRELENMIERLVVTSSDTCIGIDELPNYIKGQSSKSDNINTYKMSYKEQFDLFEKNLLENTKKNSKSTKEMSDALKIDSSTIRRKLKKHNIDFIF